MKRPIIGISCSQIADESKYFTGNIRAYVNDDYIRSVSYSAVPLMIPLIPEIEKDLLMYYMDMIDGLILSGGHDIDPDTYDEDPMQKLKETLKERDKFDLSLLRGAMDKKIPVLGICRGMQMINIYFHGTLLQDLSYSKKTLLRHVQKHDYTLGAHRVKLKTGNIFYDLLGEEFFVNSWHHQVIDKLGEGLKVCAESPDGVIEAIINPEKNIIGTQWHPEMMSKHSEEMREFFKYFSDLCLKVKNKEDCNG